MPEARTPTLVSSRMPVRLRTRQYQGPTTMKSRDGLTTHEAGALGSRCRRGRAATGRGLLIGIHDGGGDRSQTIAALPAIIDGLRARGYTMVRLCQ